MKQKSSFFITHLSVLSMVVVYLAFLIEHLISDGFILSNQLSVLLIMVPCIVLGFLDDYMLNHANTKLSFRIIGKLCLLCLFLIRLYINLAETLESTPPDWLNYIHYLFLTLPFFISGYEKESHHRKLIYTIIGMVAIGFTYMYLANGTDELTTESGSIFYFASFVFMIYSAGSFKKLPFIGALLACIDSLFLIYLRFFCMSERVMMHSWDYHFSYYYEISMVITFLLLGGFAVIGKQFDIQRKKD